MAYTITPEQVRQLEAAFDALGRTVQSWKDKAARYDALMARAQTLSAAPDVPVVSAPNVRTAQAARMREANALDSKVRSVMEQRGLDYNQALEHVYATDPAAINRYIEAGKRRQGVK